MVDPLTLAAFVPAALALNFTPGADMIFCMAQGLRSGPRAAWAASAGISTGSMVHVLIAGAGLSAILTQWPIALDIIRWCGVGYLLWLAFQALRRTKQDTSIAQVPGRHAYRSALIVNLTNPKVILFVLAFIPQFIDRSAGPVSLQFAVFGSVIALFGFFVNGLVGVSAGSFGRKLAQGSRLLDRITAGLFVVLALRLAVLERN